MITDIYFIQNFHGIRTFLSMYDPDRSNIVYISDTNELKQFIPKLVSGKNIITVPRVKNDYTKNPLRRELEFCSDLQTHSQKELSISERVNSKTNAYFFTKQDCLHFFIILKKLSALSVNIYFIDAVKDIFWSEPVNNTSFFKNIRCKYYSRKAGVKLCWYKSPNSPHLSLGLSENYYTEKENVVMEWKDIAKKFSIAKKISTDNAILIIDGPIDDFRDIDLDKSRDNMVNFVNNKIEEGYKIHLKPHPRHKEDHSLANTVLKNKVQVLESYFPTELIMGLYPETYSFVSATLNVPIAGQKHTLFNLLEFTDSDTKNEMSELLKTCAGSEIDNVRYI